MVVSCDGHLRRKLAVVELEHGLQRGGELLSAGGVKLWCEDVLVAKGFGRRRSVPIYIGTAGVRCARSGEGKEGGRQQWIGRDGRRATCLRECATPWTDVRDVCGERERDSTVAS
jgi:hypothetical protein